MPVTLAGNRHSKYTLKIKVIAKLYLHWFAFLGSFVNSHHVFYIAQTFFAGSSGRFVFQNAFREVIYFGGKLVAFLYFNFVGAVFEFQFQVVFVIISSRIQN